jgi:hypothetical protein
MRFIMHIMQGANLEATASLTSSEGETPEEISERARTTLMASAMDVRLARSQQVMTESMLERLVDVFAETVLEQARAGTSRHVTVYTRDGEIYRSEGQITLLGSADDITGLIDIEDDETMRRSSFGAMARRTLRREPTTVDIVFDEMTENDMDRSFEQ